MEKTIEKIRKLLRLAESDNAYEAKAAMLKARELMAVHRLSDEDIYESSENDVTCINTSISFTRRSEPWVPLLAGVIADNFCCRYYELSSKGKQLRKIGFVGKNKDIEICVMVFEYAVDCIHNDMDIIKKQKKKGGYKYNAEVYIGYGMGYVSGIDEEFMKQTETHSDDWGVVMSVPNEVIEYTDIYFKEESHKTPVSVETMSKRAFNDGVKDGKKFDPMHRLSI